MPLVERIVGGDLAGLLTAWRSEGLTLDQMAVRMRTQHDVAVTRETLRRWCHDLGVDLASAGTGGEAA
jgi:hypothetical protein